MTHLIWSLVFVVLAASGHLVVVPPTRSGDIAAIAVTLAGVAALACGIWSFALFVIGVLP